MLISDRWDYFPYFSAGFILAGILPDPHAQAKPFTGCADSEACETRGSRKDRAGSLERAVRDHHDIVNQCKMSRLDTQNSPIFRHN